MGEGTIDVYFCYKQGDRISQQIEDLIQTFGVGYQAERRTDDEEGMNGVIMIREPLMKEAFYYPFSELDFTPERIDKTFDDITNKLKSLILSKKY